MSAGGVLYHAAVPHGARQTTLTEIDMATKAAKRKAPYRVVVVEGYERGATYRETRTVVDRSDALLPATRVRDEERLQDIQSDPERGQFTSRRTELQELRGGRYLPLRGRYRVRVTERDTHPEDPHVRNRITVHEGDDLDAARHALTASERTDGETDTRWVERYSTLQEWDGQRWVEVVS